MTPNFAESVRVYELAYRTPFGRHGRKQVSSDRIVRAVETLREKGYYDVRVSTDPLYEHTPVFVKRM